MNRRKIFLGVGIALATNAVVAPSSLAQNQKVSWRMATSWPKSLDTVYGGAEIIADCVKKTTDGRFSIRAYEAGELVPGTQVLDAVQAGTVQAGHTASYYYIGKNPALAFGTTVPFGMTADQQNAWMYYGGGLELMREVYDDFNIINFPAGNTGTQAGGWFNKEVKTVNDIKGLKMRIPGLGGQVMSKLGANVQLLPGGEIYLALDRGALDAAEWVGPYDDEKLGLHKAAKYYYHPGWWEPSAMFELLVNKKEYEKLPKEYKEALASCSAEANVRVLAEYDHKNQAALDRLVKGGTQLRTYSPEIMRAGEKAMNAIHAENAAKSADYKKVYAAYEAYKKNIRQWHDRSRNAFTDFVEDRK